MNMKKSSLVIVSVVLVMLVLSAGCAPGPYGRFAKDPAGFWAGLWHGLICVITFIISLFTNQVRMYEVNNTGPWYNFGFLIGAACFFGGSWGSHYKKRRKKSIREKDWEEIGLKAEEKVRQGIKNWLKESDQKDKDWDEIAEKIEEKIKRELREWTEK